MRISPALVTCFLRQGVQGITDLFTERVFAAISSIQIPEMGTKQIHVSMGVSFCLEHEEISFDRLYKEADEAMYQSKKVEGCCVTFYKHEKE